MPAGDITHPVPDLTGYITEGQIVLAPDVHARGIYPPIDPLSSLSRLMRSGAGPGRTRDDHLEIAAQLLAALARARQVRELAEIVGASALSATDQLYLDFATQFEQRLANQHRGERTRLSTRPSTAAGTSPTCCRRRELTMLSPRFLDAHPPTGG